MKKNIIFDIGFHKGEDTKYYLSLGYTVIAVEANPILVDLGKKIFKEEIENKKLTLLNIGVANQKGKMPFYVNLDQSEWSSFNEESATRNNSKYKIIDIPTTKFSELLVEYGTPFYAKIDIEGNDICCITDLNYSTLPTYISCEAGSVELLDLLFSKGYKKFKLINQGNGFKQINTKLERKWWYPKFIFIRNGLNKRLGNILPFKYKFASSGPFGENTDGKWRNYAIVREQYLDFQKASKELNTISWFDFHAKL